MQRLEEMGVIDASRSLDASPNSRSRRYRIVDPFTAFWFRFVLPNRTDLDLGRSEAVWGDVVRPALDDHLSGVFGRVCREWMERYADEELPARAREVGGLWGRGYDLEVAGTLTNGAVFYGRTRWGENAPGHAAVEELDRQAEKTRYGFGRDEGYRLVFTDRPARDRLRRRHGGSDRVHVVGPRILVGR